MVMRVGIDIRSLNRGHVRGIGKYVRNVLLRCEAENLAWECFSDRFDLPLHVAESPRRKVHTFDPPGYRFHCWEQYCLPRLASRLHVDVIHCTETTLPWWQPVPTVVTVHDTVPFMEITDTPGHAWYWRRLIPAAYRKCAAIITISEHSRKDIVNLWPEAEEKIRVIPHGIDDVYVQATASASDEGLWTCQKSAPYLLYIGGEVARKRFDWALRVLERLRDLELNLVACGIEREAAERIRCQICPVLRDRVVFAPFVSEQEMRALYSHAIATLYPTLYEGFGFPVVESQAVGTPVLFSRLSSLGELVGPGAIVLPPDDLDAWVQTCRRLFERRRGHLQPDGAARAWARRYSWDESAARHMEVYRLVAAAKSARRHEGRATMAGEA
jgi:alpha-1,3-rhamnosyl/mannosyltransferase